MSKLIIKIGGSFLTKKAHSGVFPTTIDGIISQGDKFIEKKRLESISQEIADISKKHQIMIVHGAGPFGHALVEKIMSGASIDVPDVHRSMLVLNEAVNTILRNRGMTPITLSPIDYVEYDGDFSTSTLVSEMTSEIGSGNLPVSHGDIVRVKTGSGRIDGYEVISGDRVASDLALGWQVDSVIMVTDMDGILDRDPAISKGERIPEIRFQECLDLLRGRGSKGADVTGGIAQKVVSCREPILSGIPLKIISGLEYGNLLSASEDGDVGTTIKPG
jgi:isopentenyl phosphate kinase